MYCYFNVNVNKMVDMKFTVKDILLLLSVFLLFSIPGNKCIVDGAILSNNVRPAAPVVHNNQNSPSCL